MRPGRRSGRDRVVSEGSQGRQSVRQPAQFGAQRHGRSRRVQAQRTYRGRGRRSFRPSRRGQTCRSRYHPDRCAPLAPRPGPMPIDFSATVTICYLTTLAVLGVYGLHRLLLVTRFRWGVRAAPGPVEGDFCPRVTVQLPLFNERTVARA